MNTRRQWLCVLGLLFASPTIFADDLQALAALCATQPESTELDEQWAGWVADNYRPGMDLDAVIEDLLNRADRYRWSRHSSTGDLTWSAGKKQRIRQDLQVTALATIKQRTASSSDG